jgi:hypothetical protein
LTGNGFDPSGKVGLKLEEVLGCVKTASLKHIQPPCTVAKAIEKALTVALATALATAVELA